LITEQQFGALSLSGSQAHETTPDMLVHICHTVNNDYVSETVIMNFLKYHYRLREMILNLSNLQSTLSSIDGERGTKIPHKIFPDEELRLKKIHQELLTTLRVDTYGRSQIKIWHYKFKNGDLPCKDAPRLGRPPLTLVRNLRDFLKSILLPMPEYLRSIS
jgi:hypothetical protein